ncbi:MAG: GTPase domain-containing protein [Polyangiales bacterium]
MYPVEIGDQGIALHDVPGDGRSSNDEDFDDARFSMLLDALEAAQVIVHVIDASDDDAERLGARLDRWIYGSGHDLRAAVIPVLTKCDRASAEQRASLRAVWKDAHAVSATTGEGIEALRDALALSARTAGLPRPAPPAEPASLIDLQLSLLARVASPEIDGPGLAEMLRAGVDKGEVRGVVTLREGAVTFKGERADFTPHDLRTLGRLAENVWDADTLHVLTAKAAQAKRLAERLRGSWGAAACEVVDARIVRARWRGEGITAAASADPRTVQDLQLELVRRGGYNAFRGDRIASSLAAHRGLWRAVMFGRPRVTTIDGGQRYEARTWLNPVLEIADDAWNADTLWVVAHDADAAARVRALGETHWFADEAQTLDADAAKRWADVDPPAVVVQLWWD